MPAKKKSKVSIVDLEQKSPASEDISKEVILSKIEVRPTGIDEIDRMLGGGLPEKATVLLSGDAGVGKTTLAMEWLFEGYSKFKETGVYITLTESTTVAIHNLSDKTFFNKNHIASADVNVSQINSEIVSRPGIHFVDLRQILEEMNLLKTEYTYKDVDKIHEVLFDIISATGVSRVVIDSITAMAYLLDNKSLIRTFIYKMGKFLALSNANTLLVGEARGKEVSIFGVEEFISDGVIRLLYEDSKGFPIRTLQIKKMRGINFDSKPVAYKITNDGTKLFPREPKKLDYIASKDRMPTGVVGFDSLISGGLLAKSSVLISGPSGSGKTLFSIQTMVNSLKNGRKCLYISHEESRNQILRNARAFGWDLEHYESQELLKIESIHPDEIHLSELISDVRDIIEDFSPDIVIIDSLTAVENLYEQRIVHDWASQLISLFKKKGILAMFLSATSNLVGASVASNIAISSLFDQIIMIRFVEIDSEFHHAILIIKMRGSKHDKKMYQFVFEDDGLRIVNSFSGYEGIFSGSAKQVSKSKEDRLHEIFMEILGPMGEELFTEQKEKGLSINIIDKMIEELVDQGILDSDKEEQFTDLVRQVFEGGK